MGKATGAATVRWVGIALAVSMIVATAGGLAVQVRNNTAALTALTEKLDAAVGDRYTGTTAARDWAKQERVDDKQNVRIDKLIELQATR